MCGYGDFEFFDGFGIVVGFGFDCGYVYVLCVCCYCCVFGGIDLFVFVVVVGGFVVVFVVVLLVCGRCFGGVGGIGVGVYSVVVICWMLNVNFIFLVYYFFLFELSSCKVVY